MPDKNTQVFVYIVDDDEAVRNALSRLMRAAHHEHRAYESAERFLAEVRNQRSACILLDITMPHMSGLQVQTRLQELRIRLPVIALSARDDEETRDRARELGASFFLRKPVDDQALLDAITWVVESQIPPGSKTPVR